MKIIRRKSFIKSYKALSKKWREKTDTTLRLFLTDPLNPSLRNHALKGKLKGLRAISVTSDLRIIFEEKDGYTIVILVCVGTHNQVY